jgi:hypothetical protein
MLRHKAYELARNRMPAAERPVMTVPESTFGQRNANALPERAPSLRPKGSLLCSLRNQLQRGDSVVYSTPLRFDIKNRTQCLL